MFRQQRRKRKISLFICVCILVILLVGLSYFFIGRTILRIPSYISPLPFAFFPIDSQTSDPFKLQLSEMLKEQNIPFTDISVYVDGTVVVTLVNKSTVVLSKAKDLSEQVSSLQLIYSRLTIEGKEFSRLDLRFENPVIIFGK